jgi:uncharacterized protein YdeI (BOF family)
MKKILLITSLTALFSMAAFAQDATGLKTDKAPPPPHKMEGATVEWRMPVA